MKRRGFTLIELMVVIAIIIILAAIAIPNYLRMTERAKRSRLQSDFATLATCLETFKTDWGKYPNKATVTDVAPGEAVNLAASVVHCELSGMGANGVYNIATKVNAVGETNGAAAPFIEYLKDGTMTSMTNPFDSTKNIMYGSKDGNHWILYVETTGTNPFMWRTDTSSTPTFNAAAPATAAIP
ncbi:MAG: type II secretion system protein [Candidatus Cryosericum sp.]